MNQTADDMWEKALESKKVLTVDDVVDLADRHASLGHGGLLLKGRITDALLQDLRRLRYEVVVIATTYEAIPTITLISWS